MILLVCNAVEDVSDFQKFKKPFILVILIPEPFSNTNSHILPHPPELSAAVFVTYQEIVNLAHQFRQPIMPQQILAPEFPVLMLSSSWLRPKSSCPMCTTSALPMTLRSPPVKLMMGSRNSTLATPSSPALMLPRSPT